MRMRVPPSARRRANRLMPSTLRVVRYSGKPRLVPGSLEPVRDSAVVYEGRGKAQSYEAHEQSVTVAGASITVIRVRIDVPVNEGYEPRPGDVVTVLANPDDSQLEGKEFRLASEAPFKSMATAYRVFADLVVRDNPEGSVQ